MVRSPQSQSPSPTLPPETRIGAVLSTYHRELCDAMLASARAQLASAGLAEDDLVVVEVPGAFEIPLIARELGMREDLAAVMCFGLVLKGETSHDYHIASAVSHTLAQVALECDKPILFGVLTCDTLEQARARALPSGQDKGREVARAAVGALAAKAAALEVGRERRKAGFFSGLGLGDAP